MNSCRVLVVALAVTLPALAARPARAAWPSAPQGLPIATLPAAGSAPTMIPDGLGGAILTWIDTRLPGNAHDIYAQRISASGVPLWTVNGVGVCIEQTDQSTPRLVSDGAGGAIIVWSDQRNFVHIQLYAQRISSTGVPLWAPNGVPVLNAGGDQYYPSPCPDGSGGVIVGYTSTGGGMSVGIHAQHLRSDGVRQWADSGVVVCTVAGAQSQARLVADGAGGAILTWSDLRLPASDLYAQRLNAAGDTLWAANGVPVCKASGTQNAPVVAPDGAGGALIAWQDGRASNSQAYAQRVSGAGVALWTLDGVALASSTGVQTVPAVCPDGTGGAIACWQEQRGAALDLYAQRIGPAGTPSWAAAGVSVCTAPGQQVNPTIVADDAHGAIVAWQDGRTSPFDIHAQGLDPTGAPRWEIDGIRVSVATPGTVNEEIPIGIPDGSGGAILVWENLFTDATINLYAQRVERYGQIGSPEPAIAQVKDSPADQGGFVSVAWNASYVDASAGIYEYRLFRSAAGPVPGAPARRVVTTDSDVAAREGVLLARESAGATVYWEYVGTTPATQAASYAMASPTTSDSIAGSNPRTLFMVEALSSPAISSAHWFSAPDSGYSVDNLAPATPAGFAGTYVAGTVRVQWRANHEADLVGYRLYRGTTAAFAPGPANLVTATADTGYAGSAGIAYVYKLTAVDVHGNASPPATLVPTGATAGGDDPPFALSLAAPSPNPARGTATLQYTLTRYGAVRLEVYDAAGRRVQVVRAGEREAGTHREDVPLRDERGRELASGLYLVRLEAEGRVLTRRMVAIR